MEMRLRGMHGRAASLGAQWRVAATAAALAHRAILSNPLVGASPDASPCRLPLEGGTDGADGCASGISVEAAQPAVGDPWPCGQDEGPLRTSPPLAHPRLTFLASEAVSRPALPASAPLPLPSSCRSRPLSGPLLPAWHAREIPATSRPRGRFYGSSAAEEQPVGVGLDTKPVFIPRAPVCVDLDRRWLFVSDTPNNRIVMASLDSGEIQGTIGCGVPGVADGTWESAEFSHPAGLLLDAEANALYVADRKGRAVRRVSLDERHDDQRGGHQVVTVHPPPAPPAPRPTFLQRTWHHVMYLLFLTEPPPNTDVIPAATTYYTRPGISGEGHPGAGKRGAEGSSTGGYGGDELEPWRLAWGPQGKDTLLVTNQGCTRAWSLHLPSLEVSPVDVSQWSSSLPEPASGGSASFAHYFDAAERAATSADGFTYSISEAGNVAVEPSGVQAQEKPSLAAADSPASGTGPRASSGAAEGGPRILRLSNLAALGVPPMWKVPAEPMSLFRYRELSPRSETSDSATALGTPGRGGREGTLASEPEGSGVGTPASHRPASTGVGSVFRFAAVVGQGRHRGVLRVGVPAGWQLEELPDTATAWVQCRGSAVELSVLGGQLEGSRVSWAQEWRDQLEADRWMEAVGEDQEAQNLPLDPRHEGAPTLADGVGNRTDGPARLGGLGGENAGGDGRGSNVQGASAEHASGAAAGYSGVRGAPSEEMSPASSVDEACIGFFLDASPGQAQVVIDAALYLSQGGPSASSSGAVAPFVGQHRLNARIDLDIREDGPGELEFKCQLGQGQ